MSAALRACGLGRRFGRRWALSDCTLELPAGHVTGLVGPNGAGKSTLLALAAGVLRPSAGTIEVCGAAPGAGAEHRGRVGYVAQDAPVYAGLTVADHLELGARMNPGWDRAYAAGRIGRLGLDPAQRAGALSGGQRAQLALTVGLAKRPALLLLDEPVASLDPLARREFYADLMEAVAERTLSVLLSSHVVGDLERTCDRLVVLAGSRVQVAGELDELLATHHRLAGPRHDRARLPAGQSVVLASHTERQTTLVVRSAAPIVDPAWTVTPLDVEDLVLAYLRRPPAAPEPSRRPRPALRAVR